MILLVDFITFFSSKYFDLIIKTVSIANAIATLAKTNSDKTQIMHIETI